MIIIIIFFSSFVCRNVFHYLYIDEKGILFFTPFVLLLSFLFTHILLKTIADNKYIHHHNILVKHIVYLLLIIIKVF